MQKTLIALALVAAAGTASANSDTANAVRNHAADTDACVAKMMSSTDYGQRFSSGTWSGADFQQVMKGGFDCRESSGLVRDVAIYTPVQQRMLSGFKNGNIQKILDANFDLGSLRSIYIENGGKEHRISGDYLGMASSVDLKAIVAETKAKGHAAALFTAAMPIQSTGPDRWNNVIRYEYLALRGDNGVLISFLPSDNNFVALQPGK